MWPSECLSRCNYQTDAKHTDEFNSQLVVPLLEVSLYFNNDGLCLSMEVQSHFLNYVFGTYAYAAPLGTPVVTSMVYNMGYLIPSIVLITIVLSILVQIRARLFEVK